MDRKGKGKQVAGSDSFSGRRKRKVVDVREEETSRSSKRKNPQVLQFFEDSAEVGYYGESSDEEIDLSFLNDMEDEPEVERTVKDDQGKTGNSSFVLPKEEEINEEEFDRIMEERYKPGSGFLRHADDDVKSSIEMDALVPTAKDPPIWKVKCAIGRERHSVFCLMHKFVELRKIGTKLQIISVFSVEHIKGFIFIEAAKEHDLLEACKGLTGIYATRLLLLPKAEAPHLLCVQRKTKNLSEGTWARVKSGKYKGDIAQVVAVSDTRRKALIKLIPRIDLQAMTQKYGGGVTVQKGLNPAPRLITSSELEEFRPLIQVRHDRDTGMTFENLDGLMLKDGYHYKKVSLDSLCSWGMIPSKEEILKFTPMKQKETGDVEWLSEIYGEEKKKNTVPISRGGGKGEGSSGSKSESSYELFNLICFNRKDFGLIVGMDEKSDGYKVLKEGADGPVVVTVGKKEMQNGPFDSKFTALDQNNKQISVNDVVKIAQGPSQGKQGVVRQVYRGIIFLYDESETENGGYFCCKSQMCEKFKLFTEESKDKTGGFDASAFGDSTSSPKSPLCPEREWQPRENSNSNQGDKNSIYSVGQKLRIRVGPLKGYLCRVIALRYSDVTVKLDSQHKVLTVKSEHLVEVRDRNTVLSTIDDAGAGSFQPFDMLVTEGSSADWTKGAGTSGEGSTWNMGGASSDWSSWGSRPTSDVPSQKQTVKDDNTSVWANAAADQDPASAGDWSSWGKTPACDASTVGGWGKTPALEGDAGSSKVETSSLGKQASWGKKDDGGSSWGKKDDKESSLDKKDDGGSLWGKGDGGSTWGKKDEGGSTWGKKDEGGSSWGKKDEGGLSWDKKDDGGSSWGKKDDGGSSWGKKDGGGLTCKDGAGLSWGKKDEKGKMDDEGSSWGNKDNGDSLWGKKDDKNDGGSSWGKKVDDGGSLCGKKDDEGSSWGKKDDGGFSWGKKDDGSSWGKKDDGGSSWGKKDDGGSSWGKKDDGGSLCGKKDDGSSWGKKDDVGSSWGKKDDGGSSWGKKDDGGSSWGKDDGGSSWGKEDDGGSSWAKKDDGGSSWGKNSGSSSWGKKDAGESKDYGGSSWGKKDNAGSMWGRDGAGSSWSKNDGGGSSEQRFDRGGRGFGCRRGGGRGRSFGRGQSFDNSSNFSCSNSTDPTPWGNKQDERSSWGKKEGGSSWGNKQGSDTTWNKNESGSGWGNKRDSDTSWNKNESGSGWGQQGKQDGVCAWGKQNNAGSGSSGSKTWNEESGGASDWKKEDTNNRNWSSWDTNSKKETKAGDDKPESENNASSSTWVTGNAKDGWNKKSNDGDVGKCGGGGWGS